jgi:hypothetical protein
MWQTAHLLRPFLVFRSPVSLLVLCSPHGHSIASCSKRLWQSTCVAFTRRLLRIRLCETCSMYGFLLAVASRLCSVADRIAFGSPQLLLRIKLDAQSEKSVSASEQTVVGWNEKSTRWGDVLMIACFRGAVFPAQRQCHGQAEMDR